MPGCIVSNGGAGSVGAGYSYYGCVKNPYEYHIEPRSWQQWEAINYAVSCTRLESERRAGMW